MSKRFKSLSDFEETCEICGEEVPEYTISGQDVCGKCLRTIRKDSKRRAAKEEEEDGKI